jgi:hypothetical protein
VSCDPERVTGFVDGELDAASAAAVEAHLAGCATCRAQAEAERDLRARLRGLPPPPLPASLDVRVRDATAGRRAGGLPAVVRWALPLAASLVLVGWLRGHEPFVAWDLARDHQKCFGRHPVPAKVWSAEPQVVSGWFEEQGTRLPALPGKVGDFVLVGARYCPLVSLASAPHVYYAAGEQHVSLFVVPQDVRLGDDAQPVAARGSRVRLLRVEGEVVGIVGARDGDVRAFETALRPTLTASR